MNTFNIFLVVIGLIIIVISYVISEKISGKSKDNQNMSPEAFANREMTEDEKQYLKKQIDVMLEEISEDVETKAYDRLGQISNQKIISVSELSEQILEKINQNHTEVVFLYNMLNEKEVQLKQLVKKINQFQKSLQVDSNLTSEDNEEMSANPETNRNVNQLNQVIEKNDGTTLEENETAKVDNQQILDMYGQGMSVIEISKQLALGQGEVKLIIDLYREKN